MYGINDQLIVYMLVVLIFLIFFLLGMCLAPHQRSCSWCFTLNIYTYNFIRLR